MKRIIFLLSILMLSTSIQAQEEFKEASIIYKNGITEKGLVQFSSTVNPNQIIFKKNGETNEITLTPNRIISCLFTGINREIVSEDIDGDHQFLETIVKGKSNLLFYIEKKGKKRYFLKSEKSGLKELTIEEKNRDTKKFTFKKFIGVLTIDFSDCQDISSRINNTSLQLSSLAKVFTQYNQCIDGTSFESERLNRKAYHKLEVEGGMYATKIKSIGTNHQSNFSQKTTPYIGVNYIFTPTFFSSKISLFTGISYFNIATQSTSKKQTILESQRMPIPDIIELKAINFQLGFLYNTRSVEKKLKPSIGVYTLLMYPTTDMTSIYRKTNYKGEESAVYQDYELNKYTTGFGLQLGCNYQLFEGNEIFIKLNYQRTGDFLFDLEQSYPFDSFIIKAGYSINL